MKCMEIVYILHLQRSILLSLCKNITENFWRYHCKCWYCIFCHFDVIIWLLRRLNI